MPRRPLSADSVAADSVAADSAAADSAAADSAAADSVAADEGLPVAKTSRTSSVWLLHLPACKLMHVPSLGVSM